MSQPEQKNSADACKHDTPFRYECGECRIDSESVQPIAKSATDEPNPFDDAAPAPAAPTAPTIFRCGLWSDGVLELQRDGVQVVALNRGEHEQLADFMGRMLVKVETVAP